MNNKDDRSCLNTEILTCQITCEIYLEPIMVFPSCQIYELEVIQEHVEKANKKKCDPLCPITNLVIQAYAPAIEIKSQIAGYLKENPNQLRDQYKRKRNHRDYKINIQAICCYKPLETDAKLAKIFTTNELSSLKVKETLAICRIKLLSDLELSHVEEVKLSNLVNNVQNLIYALGFENDPQLNTNTNPLSWQIINLQSGPRTPAMYATLKMALQALIDLDPQILTDAKVKYAGQYDLASIWGLWDHSIGSSKLNFFGAFGKDQPGDRVSKLVDEVEHFLYGVIKNTIWHTI